MIRPAALMAFRSIRIIRSIGRDPGAEAQAKRDHKFFATLTKLPPGGHCAQQYRPLAPDRGR